MCPPMRFLKQAQQKNIMANLADKAMDITETMMIVAIGIGTIAMPMILAVNLSGLTPGQLMAWGSILTVALAAIALGFIRHMRSGGKSR